MVAALYSSRTRGRKAFEEDGQVFGWSVVERIFSDELKRAERGLSRTIPGLKYAHVYRDNWTRLNFQPAKIMQVNNKSISITNPVPVRVNNRHRPMNSSAERKISGSGRGTSRIEVGGNFAM